MSNLPKQKRNQVILVAIVTGLVLSGVWMGLISWQKASLARLGDNRNKAEEKVKLYKQAIDNAEQVEASLAEAQKKLAKLEEGMATPPDLYSWAINTIKQFRLNYKVEIPQFSQIDGPKAVNMFAKFPYQQASVTVGGTAHFFELGRFIADFENRFPYIRITNVALEPASLPSQPDPEKLGFRMEIFMLVKPSAS